MKNTHDLTRYGLELSVTGTYIRGIWGDYENPPEPTTFEIDSVYCDGVNLTELFDCTYIDITWANKCNECKTVTKVRKISAIEDLEQEILEKFYE
jgi:hypothetical protein